MKQASFAARTILVLAALAGCGGDGGGNGPSVVVSVTPGRDTITVGTSTSLTATVTGATNTAVTWSILEGPVAGFVSAAGLFSAGINPGTYRIVATSDESPASKDTTVVLVVNAPLIREFRTVGGKAPAGGVGLLELNWATDLGVIVSVQPGIGVVGSDSFLLANLPGAGPLQFVASVRSLADSVVTDTVTLEVVAPAAGIFQPTGSLATARSWAAMAELQDGTVLVAGGSTAELYDPGSGQFTSTGPLGKSRPAPLAVTLSDGRVLVVGFDDVQGPSTELYDPTTGEFTPGPNTTNAGAAGIALLTDGRVFVLTGASTAEIFDPATDTFTASGSMSVGRSLAGVVPLLDGRVLVAGGFLQGTGETTSAQIFDPVTGQFTATGSMAAVHSLGTFTRLADGRVLAAGGISTIALDWTLGGEVYDPALGTWSPVGQLALPKYDHSAVLLDDGRVLLASGLAGFYIPTPYAETFDPTTGEFTPLLGTLGTSRQQPNMLRMNDGRVLIVGGRDSPATTAVEVFE